MILIVEFNLFHLITLGRKKEYFREILVYFERRYINHSCRNLVAPWCSGYHYCITSFSKTWTQILRILNSCSRRVRDLRWWGSLTMVPARNKAKRLSSVNHTTKTIHHHHHHHHHHIIIIIIITRRRSTTE